MAPLGNSSRVDRTIAVFAFPACCLERCVLIGLYLQDGGVSGLPCVRLGS